MSASVVITPDESVLRAHLEGVRFQMGVADRLWRLEDLTWPRALLTVAAAVRPKAPDEFAFLFDLSGYPEAAPTACIWDSAKNSPLVGSARPRGSRGAILQIFRDDWLEGRALYAPYDRLSLANHPDDWADKWPMSKWTRDRDLTFVLRQIYDELHAVGYVGI
jgi:hypothetical protein